MKVPIPWAPLFPSQISGETSREMARWRGDWRDFWVQWHEDRVYFQLVEGEPTVWASLETCAQSEAISCFENAVLERRYGACFSAQTKVRYGKTQDCFSLHFIYAPDGTGILREWFSRDWIAFAPNQTRIWALWPDLHLPAVGAFETRECCQLAAGSVRDEIRFRRIPDQDIAHLSWRSQRTEEEFARVMNWIWNAGLFDFGDRDRRWASVNLNCYSLDLKSSLYLPRPKGPNNARLFDWLRAYFVGEGIEWRVTDWGQRKFRKLRAREPHLRAFFAPHSIAWNVPFGKRDEPSFHQQIEARLQLRDWLRDKATSTEIETFLRPE